MRFRQLIDILLFILLVLYSELGFITYLIVRELFDTYIRMRNIGLITENGIKMARKGKELPFDKIESIESEYRSSNSFFTNTLTNTLVLKINTTDGYFHEVCIKEKDLLKLVKTGFNKWYIQTIWDPDKPFLKILPGVQREDPCREDPCTISYSAIGRYASLTPGLGITISLVTFLLLIVLLYLNLITGETLILIGGLYIFVLVFPLFYKMVKVQVTKSGVSLTDSDITKIIPISKIEEINKGF